MEHGALVAEHDIKIEESQNQVKYLKDMNSKLRMMLKQLHSDKQEVLL